MLPKTNLRSFQLVYYFENNKIKSDHNIIRLFFEILVLNNLNKDLFKNGEIKFMTYGS